MNKTNLSCALALSLSLMACGDDAKDKAASTAIAEKVAATAEEAPAVEQAAKYDKSMRKNGCEMLTPDMVAATFDAPQDALRQIKVVGCVYSWKSDERVVEARISLPMVHRSVETAMTWFSNATRDVTPDEAQQQVDQAMGKVADKAADGELGAGVTKSAVNTVQQAMEGLQAEGARYADLAGVGDAARINLTDGSIWVRVNNLTFSVAGYAGPPQPRFKPKTLNLKTLAADAQAASRAWIEKTLDDRKRDGEKLAKVIVAAL